MNIDDSKDSQKGLFGGKIQEFKALMQRFKGNIPKLFAFLHHINWNTTQDKTTPLGSYIEEFNQLGYLKLQFNQSLIPEIFFLEDLSSDVIQIKIKSENPDKLDLSFEWEPTFIDYYKGYIEF
jgi:hypothetical protein